MEGLAILNIKSLHFLLQGVTVGRNWVKGMGLFLLLQILNENLIINIKYIYEIYIFIDINKYTSIPISTSVFLPNLFMKPDRLIECLGS